MPRLASLTGRLLSGNVTYTAPEPSVSYLGVTVSPTTTNEGTSITATVSTSGVADGVTVGYTITGVSSGDLSSGLLTGTITINSNTGTVTFGIANDGLTEGQDIFTITLAATDSAGTSTLGASASAIVNDTSNDPTTSLWLDDNDAATTVRTIIGATSMQINGVFASNPSVPRTIEGRTSGTRTTITAVTARTGTYIEVDDTGNSTSFVIGESLNLANITYSVSPAANNINEGSGLTFTVTTTNLPNGITLYWTVNRPEDFAVSSGSFTINTNTATFTVTPSADTTTEGAETFTASVRTGSTSGTVVATSSSVTINDTSLTADPNIIISSYVTGTSASSAQTRAGISQSINFSGTQTQSLIATTNAAFATYPVTVEAWVYSSTTGGNILNLQNTTTGQNATYFNNGVAQSDRTSNFATILSGAAWSTGAWQHIAYTLWSSTGSTTVADRISVFLNGIANGSGSGGQMTLPTSPDNYTATNLTRILLGRNQFSLGSSNSPFTGFISEIRVSNTARYGTINGSPVFTPNVNTPLAIDGNTLARIRAV